MPITTTRAGYTGSRFYRCDLQMQTPADRGHWRGAEMGPSDAEMDAAAEAQIRRCYDVGLEVIAITDHNFASKDFIPRLEAAIGRLCGEFGYRIVLFPGFEINADVGKGCHVLALFEPGTDLQWIDHIVTECGVPPERFVNGQALQSRKRLPEILKIVQRRDGAGTPRGLVILPHPTASAGIFDNGNIADWLQAIEYVNPDVLCLEVPKPLHKMSAGFQKLLANGPDCDPMWRRVRPVGLIMSSDCKALRPEDGADNFIGFRSSWIKMSKPSIESLRQAFLDRDSRIRLQDSRPEEAYEYSKITGMEWSGVSFLKDGRVEFSENLNTIIGGRGTGKSTLVEYLRLALGQEAAIQGKPPMDNLQSIKSTLVATSRIRLTLEKERQQIVVERTGTTAPRVAEGPEAPEVSLFFPARVLSQGEIKAISDDPRSQLRLLDDVIRVPLAELERRADDLTREIRGLHQQIAALPELQARNRVLATERQDLEVRLNRLKELEAPLARWKGFLAEDAFFKRLEEETLRITFQVNEVLSQQEFTATALGSELGESPNALLTRIVATEADTLLERFRTEVNTKVEAFGQAMAELLRRQEVVAWAVDYSTAKTEFEALRVELAQQGTDPEQYLTYQRNLREKDVELGELRKRIAGVSELERRCYGDPTTGGRGLLGDLHEVWQKQTELRQEAAARLQEGVPLTRGGQPFVKVSVEEQCDEDSFMARLREEPRDKRRLSDDDLTELLRSVLATAAASQLPPCHVLGNWVEELGRGQRPDGCPWAPSDRRAAALLAVLTPAKMAELCLWRTPDRVRIYLYRNDDSLVGELAERKMSVGQRCTVILALLLAHDTVPIVIDQPEEDLDNEFVFQELVPLLRKAKERRQIILVTHNANIPVNGDAELVLGLEVKDGKGVVKTVSGQPACGGLDRTAVKLAVEDIMEGSEEAFRKRFEKYGF